jgi:ABC-type phosphate transport system substrate-binding protein
VKRNLAFCTLCFSLLAACATPTPQPTPQLINVYVTDAAYPWVSGLYDCAATFAAINLVDPASADLTLRLGEPDHLITPAYQISAEDLLVIANPQSGVDSLTLDQIRSLFLGQATNWKEVGGNDIPVQVWTFSSYEDVQGIFSKVVMNGQPVTSLARLATSAQVMQGAIDAIPGSIGILPRRLLEGNAKSIFMAAKVPVLAITKSEPEGATRDLISCLQGNH